MNKTEFKEFCVAYANDLDLTPTAETTHFKWENGTGYVFFYDKALTKVEVFITERRRRGTQSCMMYRKADGGYAKDRPEHNTSGWTVNTWTQ